ncbi:MAG: archaeal proteasome endopeptidase complex subunit beta [Sulfolobales archaeon]|nr:archaeal proteasome endopeptidase complex subunit beta [Sulfolobales archaeon]MDW8010235.1 archaeal proteasome endopeptidase complex subunit beta [Sulfolobales archaeon]
MSYDRLGTGATAVGLKLRNAVVLAAEKRVSYGSYVVSKAGKKVYLLADRFGMALAGLFADIQTIARWLSVEIRSYEIQLGYSISVKGAAKLLSTLLYRYKYYPFLSEVIFGGIDETGPHLFVMDPLGSLVEDNYAAIGTGAPIAIGIIESVYREDLDVAEAERLVFNAVKAAISRDAVSGDGVDVAVVSSGRSYEKFYPVA